MLGLNDHFVTLQQQPPMHVSGWILWRFEQPICIVAPLAVHDITGTVLPAGQRLKIAHMADQHLRPIRPQADDAVDEIIQRVGIAPMTLTEVMQWSEVSHG